MLDDLRIAAQRIEQFHRRQREQNWELETEDGILLGQRTVALGAAPDCMQVARLPILPAC